MVGNMAYGDRKILEETEYGCLEVYLNGNKPKFGSIGMLYRVLIKIPELKNPVGFCEYVWQEDLSGAEFEAACRRTEKEAHEYLRYLPRQRPCPHCGRVMLYAYRLDFLDFLCSQCHRLWVLDNAERLIPYRHIRHARRHKPGENKEP